MLNSHGEKYLEIFVFVKIIDLIRLTFLREQIVTIILR